MPDIYTKVSFLYNAAAQKIDSGVARPGFYGAAGWSETFYFKSAPQSTQLESAIRNYVTKRRACLAQNCTLVAVRQSQVEPYGPSIMDRYNEIGRAGLNNDFSSAVLYNLRSVDNAQKRPFLIRGVPDEMCETAAYFPTVDYANKVKAWLRAIQTDEWYMHGIDPTPTAHKIETIVETIAPAAQVTTELAHDLVLGDLVQILRTRRDSDKRYRGAVARISAVNGRVISISPFTLGNCTGGRIRKKNPDRFVDIGGSIEDFSIGHLTHRDAGRPFFLSRGRRSARLA